MGRDSGDANALSREEDDGLVIPEVGPWSTRKYHFLWRYLRMFSTGMKNKWPERHYIDLFAGAGKVRLRGTNEVIFGSPMLAARVPDHFTSLHLCEPVRANAQALDARLATTQSQYKIWEGDANEVIGKLLEQIPRNGTLCVSFVDPFGLHFDFETARRLAEHRSDLIVLMADNMDALRNWATYYDKNPDSTLDKFMGEPGWRRVMQSTPSANKAAELRSRYCERLRSLGYKHFDSERVKNTQGRDIYSLIFASKSSVGLDFWRKAAAIDERGQRSLPSF